jgi:hypothetical protein
MLFQVKEQLVVDIRYRKDSKNNGISNSLLPIRFQDYGHRACLQVFTANLLNLELLV